MLDRQVDGPALHALVVGVGYYPDLKGGSAAPHGAHLELGQLSSPPLSASRLAEWLLARDHEEMPLASIELLTSPSVVVRSGDSRGRMVETATTAALKAAFERWYQRCDSDERNVALFYFCGHGIQKEKLALLLEDFYADPDEPFQGALDFEGTHRGMAPCAASTQVLIADACRSVSAKTLDALDFQPRTFKRPRLRGGDPADAPRIYATSRDARAWARPGQPTEFVEALISSLEGRAAQRTRTGRWIVTTGGLVPGITYSLEDRARHGVPPQRARGGGESSGTSTLCTLKQPPEVPAVVGCRPEVATAEAHLQLDDEAVYRRNGDVPAAPGAWTLPVRAGSYEAHARFPSGEYRDSSESLLALPPEGGEAWLEVEP